MEYQYITFKPEGKRELKMRIREFQDLHPEINFYAFFSKYPKTSKMLKNNPTAEKMILSLLAIPEGIPVEMCEFLQDYVNYEKSNITVAVTLRNIASVQFYIGQEIYLTIEESEARKPYIPNIISSYKVSLVDGLKPNEFLQRRKIYLEALNRIGNNKQINFDKLFETALKYDIDSYTLAKIAPSTKDAQFNPERHIPQNKRIQTDPEYIKVLPASYFEKFTKEEIEFITQFNLTPSGEKILLNFGDIPDEKLYQVWQCLKGKYAISLRISPEDKRRILNKNISFKGIDVSIVCNLVSEATENFISRFDSGEVTISPNESTETKVDINRYKILLRKLRKIVKGISLDEPEEVRFKKVYTRLAKKLEYDYETVVPSEKLEQYREENCRTSRNLVNSLLKGKCVCAGAAETLKQALSLVNIKCLNRKSERATNEYGEIITHKYNIVKLNGRWYNVDLTWDMRNIKQGRYPCYCLKNDKEFVDMAEGSQPKLYNKKEKVEQAIKDRLRDIKEHLIRANILGDNQSKTLLLPQPNKNDLWRQSVRANTNPNMRINTMYDRDLALEQSELPDEENTKNER